jgi:sigma-B regulation protein RsbU (phosphoserine phosphatase)
MVARYDGEGRFIAAGAHQPVFIRRVDGRVDVVEPEGMWCGIAPSVHHATLEYGFHVAPGETVCLVTDGVLEAQDENAELFGDERLRDVLAARGAHGAAAALDEVFAAVERFSALQADDVTAVVLRRHDAA